jgi:hypothetical protein
VYKRQDLKKAMLEALKTEEMLAYSVFTVPVAGRPPLEGFCKIAKPKTTGKLSYFSVFYIIDTPDDESRSAASQFTARIDWRQLKNMVPEVDSEMGIPHQSIADNFFLEREIFVNNPRCLTREYVHAVLYPALVRVTGFRGSEITFWDAETKPASMPTEKISGKGSLIDRLKAFLQI